MKELKKILGEYFFATSTKEFYTRHENLMGEFLEKEDITKLKKSLENHFNAYVVIGKFLPFGVEYTSLATFIENTNFDPLPSIVFAEFVRSIYQIYINHHKKQLLKEKRNSIKIELGVEEALRQEKKKKSDPYNLYPGWDNS